MEILTFSKADSSIPEFSIDDSISNYNGHYEKVEICLLAYGIMVVSWQKFTCMQILNSLGLLSKLPVLLRL